MNYPSEAYISLPAADLLLKELNELSKQNEDVDHTLSYQLSVASTLNRHGIRVHNLAVLYIAQFCDVVGDSEEDYRMVQLYWHLREEGSVSLSRLLRDWMFLWNACSYDFVAEFADLRHQGSV